MKEPKRPYSNADLERTMEAIKGIEGCALRLLMLFIIGFLIAIVLYKLIM